MARTLGLVNRRLAPLSAAAVVLAALTLGVTGCAPEPEGPTASGSATPSASPSASASASATPTPTEDATGAACLVGEWEMGQADLEEFYNDINALMAGAGVTFSPEGSAALTLGDDGTFTWAPNAVVTANASGTTILVTLGGTITGTYTATDTRIATDTESTAGLQISATINGEPTDAGAISEQIGGAPITDAAYTCSADTATFETSVADGSATTILHRR